MITTLARKKEGGTPTWRVRNEEAADDEAKSGEDLDSDWEAPSERFIGGMIASKSHNGSQSSRARQENKLSTDHGSANMWGGDFGLVDVDHRKHDSGSTPGKDATDEESFDVEGCGLNDGTD